MPRVSIITPTFNRPDLLPALWDCVRAQSVQDFEWLVHDGSPERVQIFDAINDQRISYTHVPEPMTIGAKRNALCAAAKGEIIAHFDDDDFYGPRYIERMVSFMEDLNVDFVKLFGFFLYHRMRNEFAYWDLERDFPLHFCLHTSPEQPLTLVKRRGGVSAPWGYGFSYVFYRHVWDAIHFPDQNHGEDQVFADNAVAKFKSAGKQDFACSCLHIIHTTNTSIAFPQQILPKESLAQLFPDFHI
jgi:glycosyltransferase involved in cell wall biosynthesis